MASRKSIETSNSNSAPRYTLFLWSSICIPNFFVHRSQITDPCTKKVGMQIELHRNNVYLGAELLLLVSMLFLLAIPKCILIFKENFYYTSFMLIEPLHCLVRTFQSFSSNSHSHLTCHLYFLTVTIFAFTVITFCSNCHYTLLNLP